MKDVKKECFKPYYNWNTFNTLVYDSTSCGDFGF